MHNISMGTVIHGTLRNEDLIPTFIAEIIYYDENNGVAQDIDDKLSNVYDFNSDEACEDINNLIDELDTMALPHSYFGVHPGDGSDYGFWVEIDNEWFDGMTVDDISAVPESYSGEVLFTNDHGNMTLYNSEMGELTEVWSVV